MRPLFLKTHGGLLMDAAALGAPSTPKSVSAARTPSNADASLLAGSKSAVASKGKGPYATLPGPSVSPRHVGRALGAPSPLAQSSLRSSESKTSLKSVSTQKRRVTISAVPPAPPTARPASDGSPAHRSAGFAPPTVETDLPTAMYDASVGSVDASDAEPASGEPEPVSEAGSEHQERAPASVRVVCRFRPMSVKEIREGDVESVSFDGNGTTVDLVDGYGGRQSYHFDRIFGPDSMQADVYDVVGRPVVEGLFEGYNGTIFAYGQVGSLILLCCTVQGSECTVLAVATKYRA
jgi:hypothetical protein